MAKSYNTERRWSIPSKRAKSYAEERKVKVHQHGQKVGKELTDYEAKSTENQTLIKSCYFSVRIYDSSSRASKTINFFM